jgi:hypothetical protein
MYKNEWIVAMRLAFVSLMMIFSVACNSLFGGTPTAVVSELPASPTAAIIAAEETAPAPPESSPTAEASPTAEPSPTAEASPTAEPSPTPSYNPHTDPQVSAMLIDHVSDLYQQGNWDRYTIYVELNPVDASFQGTLQLSVTNRTAMAWDEIYFHLYPNHSGYRGLLRVDDVRIDGESNETEGEQGNLLLRLPLEQAMEVGETRSLTMQFSGRSPQNSSRNAYGAYNQEAGVWSLATFYPILARYGADGWDTRPVSSRGDFVVSDTALYDVSVQVPEDWVLVSTGARIDRYSIAEGSYNERIVSGPQREFLLMALNGLEDVSQIVEGTRIRSFYQKGEELAGTEALRVAGDALRIFNARFGKYPLAELDVIQSPLTNFAGVEYPGIILIEQRLYRQSGRGLETTVAHEVGHQWWYNMVGNDAQGDPWLDEGLTSFSEIVYYEVIGDQQAADEALAGFRQSLQRARTAGRDGVVARPPSAMSGNYVVLVYHKGALFFQALRNRLGDELFFSVIQNYYATYRYGTATGEGFLAVAQQTCDCDLQQFYSDWILSSKQVELP